MAARNPAQDDHAQAPAAAQPAFRLREMAAAVTGAFLLGGSPGALAQQIVTDGRTATALAVSGNVTDVTTATVYGPNAFNSFQRFNVHAGNVVNLHLPSSAANLLNLVYGDVSRIDGTLNSVKDGRIGGNVFLLNPHGILVGATGVINVGSLSLVTPRPEFMDGFFDAHGAPDAARTQQVLAGQVPVGATGLISVQGRINAQGDVSIAAGAVQHAGAIRTGAAFAGSRADFGDIVNIAGMEDGAAFAVRNGNVAIVAASDVVVTGAVHADGGNSVAAGNVDVRAGRDIRVAGDAVISASGRGENSDGGRVVVFADRDATLAGNAALRANGGEVSGDGGFVEFSARRTVELAGGSLQAAATQGAQGSVLIDPENLNLSADLLRAPGGNASGDGVTWSAGSLTLQADNAITVASNVVISTRSVGSALRNDHLNANSTGASGNLTLQAASITMESGSMLLAHGTGPHAGGDILLQASDTSSNPLRTTLASGITLNGATLRGRNVTLSAESSYSSPALIELPVVVKTATAAIALNSAQIVASGNVSLSASASIDAATPTLLPFATVDATSAATVDVLGASSVTTSGGAVEMSAASTVTARAVADMPNPIDLPADASVAVALVDSRARVRVGGSSTVSAAGLVDLDARNTVDALASGDASPAGSTAVGGTVAVTVIDAAAEAYLDGAATITQAGGVNVTAESVITAVTSAVAAAQGASDQGADAGGNPNSKTQETLGDYQDQASTSDGGVQVAAAVAVADIDSVTRAYLASSAPVTSSGAVTVSSSALTQSDVVADGSTAEGGVGVGVAVGLNLARLTNEAYVAQSVNAAGVTIEALMAGAGEANAFTTSATSGAAASDVGVAGSLAVNVIDNRTRARVTGAGVVNAGGGNALIEAGNESESSAEAKPADGGASGDSFGLGASVAVNVVANEVLAEVADNGQVNGAGDVTVAAAGAHTVATSAEAGAAGGIALTPVAAITVADNTTTARLGSGGTLILAGELSVTATHSGAATTSATADVAGDKVAVGASVAVSVVNDAAVAATARGVQSAGGGVAFAATSASSTAATAKASAQGGKQEDESTPEDGVDQEIGKQKETGTSRQAAGSSNDSQQASTAQTSEGKVSVAGAVAVNVADSKAEAAVPAGGSVIAAGSVTVAASNNTDASAKADGSAAGSTAQVGVGVGVAVNTVTASTRASIGAGATVIGQGVSVTAGMTDVNGDGSDLANAFAAEASSGAGGGKVGIAGSLGLNVIDVSSVAEIGDSAAVDAGGGNVEVSAESSSGTTARALPDGPASGGKVGVGASVALNLFDQDLTRARIGAGAGVSNAGNLTVSATSASDTTAEAEAGAAGSIAIDAVVALSEVKQTTEAVIASGGAVAAGGAVSVSAAATGEHTATATGDVKSDKVGVGASAAIIISDTTTRASLERDVTTGAGADDDLTVSASATRSYEAVASASAGGSKSDDEMSQQEKDKAKSTSTLKNNESAQQGTQKTGSGSKVNVAAAAGVLVIDDDVEASIAAGRTLQAGGDIRVAAFNGSDFSARGLGDTLDETKLTGGTQVGIGVGVGLAIVRNDTAASIGANSRILDAGDVAVAAESQQNTSAGFVNKLAAEGISGAGSEKVSVAGALAVANSNSTTRASIGDNVTIDQAGAVSVETDNTSKLSAKAWSLATSGKVGVGASIAIVVADNEYQAWVGRDADLTVDSLRVAAQNHKVSGSVPFDFGLDDIENLDKATSKLTESNLQILLGENNYYTETIAGGGSNQVAVTGAFSINVFDDLTEAWIGADGEITASGAVEVSAGSDTTAKAFAGGVSAAGKVGVGIATADIVSSGETRAYLAGGADILQAGSVTLDASSALDLMVISASAAGAGTAGVSGVLSLIVSEIVVEAYAGSSSGIASAGSLAIGAASEFTALNVAGVAGIGGTAGVGVSAGVNVVDNETRAWIGDNATVRAAGLASVDADSTQDVLSVVVGGAGGGTAGVAASAATNVFNPVTQAWIGAGVQFNVGDVLLNQSARVGAESVTELLSIVGTVGIGGTAGVGGAADVVVLEKTTQAWIAGGGSNVRVGDSLWVLADSTEEIRSVGAGFSAGGTAGVQGAASVVVLDTDTQAYIAGGASAHSEGNIVVAATGDTELDLLAGAGAIGGTAGVGAAAAVAVVDKLTHAYIGDGAEVAALGRKAGVQVATGAFGVSYAADTAADGEVSAPDITPSNGESSVAGGSAALTQQRVATAGTRTHQGLAVTATNRDDVETFAVTGAASGTAAVTLSGDVSVFSADTQAWIGAGAKVNESNAGAGAAQSVLVAAGSDFYRLGIAGALSASGTAGVGVGADVAVMSFTTQAAIGANAVVNALRDVEMAARSEQEVLSISASLGASGTVGVSGSVSVLDFDNQTWASIGAGARVNAGGNVAVTARDDTDTTMIAGTVALGLGGGGVGGGVGVTTIDKDTRAWIGNGAFVDARGQNTANLTGYTGDSFAGTTAMRGLLVQAQSSEDLFTISAAGAGGLYVGIAGAVSVATVDSDTLAYIGDGARINTLGGTANGSQDVNVTARNDFSLFNVSGALGVGAVGIAGAVDVGVIRNDVTAFIGDNAVVNAARDVDVNALAHKDIETYVVSASGGLAGIAAGVGVYSVGGALDSDSRDRLKSDDGGDNAGSYADGQATNGSITNDFLKDYSDSNVQAAAGDVDSARGGTGVSGRFTAAEDRTLAGPGSRTLPGGTAAFIGRNTVVGAGRHVDVDARETVDFDMLTGALSVGAVGLGAGVGVASFQNDTRAFIDDGARITAGAAGNVTVTARLQNTAGALGIAGTGGIVAVDAAVAILGERSAVSAGLGNNVTIDRASLVRVEADDDRTLEAETYSVSVGAVTAGASVATATIGGSTAASIGTGAAIGQGAFNVNRVDVSADADHLAQADATAGKGGLGLALSGTVATATVNPTVSAGIGGGAVKAVNSINVEADAAVAARAEALGINVSLGGSVGASVATATAAPQVSAAASGALTARDLLVSGSQSLPGSGATAWAKATGASGGLLVGANATVATARNNGRATAAVGDNSTLTVSDSITVRAANNTRQRADATGISAGILALGGNVADARSSTYTEAAVGNGVAASGGALSVTAGGEDDNLALGEAGSGGVVSGLAARTTTSTTSQTYARIGDGAAGRLMDLASLTVDASHTARFNTRSSSINASVVGMSGATSSNNASAIVAATLGANLNILAGDVEVTATNRVRKPELSAPNVKSGSGGLFDGPSATSTTAISVDTDVALGDGSAIVMTGTVTAPGAMAFKAYNDLQAFDKAELTSGGAIVNAQAESFIHADTIRADVTIGRGASLLSLGNIDLAARSDARLHANAHVETYGLAGVGQGGTAARAIARDNVTVLGPAACTGAACTQLVATDRMNVWAGADERGLGVLQINADTRIFNRTLIAYTGEPTADATADRESRITVQERANLASGSHMTLNAAKGHLFADGDGRAIDLARESAEAVGEFFGLDAEGSLETRAGRDINRGFGLLALDGNLETGIYRHIELEFGTDFSPYYLDGANKGTYIVQQDIETGRWALFDPSIDPDLTPGVDSSLVRFLEPAVQSDGIRWTILTNQNIGDNLRAVIQELEDTRARYGPSNPQLAQDIDTRLTILRAQLARTNAGEFVDVIEVQPAQAATGNIVLWGDHVGGRGDLFAPGDATITITSESPMPLKVKELTIPDERGGRILYNNQAVSSGADIASRNGSVAGAPAVQLTLTDAAGSPQPRIEITSSYDPQSGIYNPQGIPDIADPDLFITGLISNINGLVRIVNEQGSIVATAGVRADTVQISAGGDFVFDNPSALFNAGPHPQAGFAHIANPFEAMAQFTYNLTAGTVGEPLTAAGPVVQGASSAIKENVTVAGNNVFINADTVNINGVIQSGLPEKRITISQADVDNAYSTPGSARFVPVKNVAVALNGDGVAVGGIKAELDRETGQVRILDADVKGGLVLISGRIASTGDGRINVMDGYGRIEIVNNSTSQVFVQTADTGGIEGQIILIDKFKDNGAGLALVTRYERIGSEVRIFDNLGANSSQAERLISAFDGRASHYDPIANARYNWMTGTHTTTQTEYRWRREHDSWLGFIPGESRTFTDAHYVQGYPQTRVLTGAELPQGDIVAVRDGLPDYTYLRRNRTTNNERVLGPIDGDDTKWVWGGFCGCIPKRLTIWTRTEVWENGTDTYNYHSVKADHRIGIHFIGLDQGRLDIASVGGVLLGGNIRNVDGVTTISSSQGDILSATSVGSIKTGNLTLSAANGSVGSFDAAIRLNQDAGDTVSVTAKNNVYLEAPFGDLLISNLTTGGGVVNLVADRNLTLTDTTGVIRGSSITLEARNGSLGLGTERVRIDTDAASGGTLTVLARNGDVRLEEVSGDLRIRLIETSGDVDLLVPGSVIDANSEAIDDVAAIARLEQVWNDMRLTGGAADAKRDDQLAAYKKSQEAAYQDYWQLRNVRQALDVDGNPVLDVGGNPVFTADAYDAGFAYTVTAAQRQAFLDQGLGEDAIQRYEQGRTAAYHAGFAAFGDVAYDPAFSYNLAGDPTVGDMTSGYKWTENELRNRMPAYVFKTTTDTTVTIEEPNIVARNVRIAAGGQIGTELPDLVLNLNGGNVLTPQVLAALAAAERDDLIRDDAAGTLTILQRDDLDIHASGTIDLTATSHIFLGGEQDVNIYAAHAGGSVRVKVEGDIVNARADGLATLSGQAMVLEAASGAIGTVDNPIRIDQAPGAALTARAQQGIYLHELNGDMWVDTLFSEQGDVSLVSAGRVLDWALDQGLNILANNIAITAAGDIGLPGGRDFALDLRLADENGRLTLASTGGGAYIFVPDVRLGLGAVDVAGDLDVDSLGSLTAFENILAGGDVALRAIDLLWLQGDIGAGGSVLLASLANSVTVDGDVTAGAAFDLQAADEAAIAGGVTAQGDATVAAAGALTLAATGSIATSGGDALLDADTIAMADGATVTAVTGDIELQAAGDILLGRLVKGGTGTVSVASAAGAIADNGDSGGADVDAPDATLRLGAAGGIGAGNALETRVAVLEARVTAAGEIRIDEADGVELADVETADGAITVNAGGTLRATRVVARNVAPTQNHDIALAASVGNIDVGLVSTTGGDATLTARDSILDVNNDDDANVLARSITLVAQDGQVGDPANYFDIDSSNDAPGLVTASGPQGVWLREVNGSLNVASIVASQGDVGVQADGSILAGAPGPHLLGNNVELESLNGSAGADGNPLLADSNGEFNVRADRGIYLEETGGDLVSSVMTTRTGSIDILIADGNGRFDHVHAPDDVTIVAQGDSLTINTLDPARIFLAVTNPGGSLTVNDAFVGLYGLLNADFMTFHNLVHTDPVNQLHLNVSGHAGGMADTVNFNISSQPGVIFDLLLARIANINLNGDILELSYAEIGERGIFRNSYWTVVVDNAVRVLYPVDVQLYSSSLPFFLRMSSRPFIQTNAWALNYRENFVINEFSTENSITRLVPKMLAIVEEEKAPEEAEEPAGQAQVETPADPLNLGAAALGGPGDTVIRR